MYPGFRKGGAKRARKIYMTMPKHTHLRLHVQIVCAILFYNASRFDRTARALEGSDKPPNFETAGLFVVKVNVHAHNGIMMYFEPSISCAILREQTLAVSCH